LDNTRNRRADSSLMRHKSLALSHPGFLWRPPSGWPSGHQGDGSIYRAAYRLRLVDNWEHHPWAVPFAPQSWPPCILRVQSFSVQYLES